MLGRIAWAVLPSFGLAVPAAAAQLQRPMPISHGAARDVRWERLADRGFAIPGRIEIVRFDRGQEGQGIAFGECSASMTSAIEGDAQDAPDAAKPTEPADVGAYFVDVAGVPVRLSNARALSRGGNALRPTGEVRLAPAGVSKLPEPATWGMMLVGMGLTGWAVRRRLKQAEDRFNARVRRIAAGELL